MVSCQKAPAKAASPFPLTAKQCVTLDGLLNPRRARNVEALMEYLYWHGLSVTLDAAGYDDLAAVGLPPHTADQAADDAYMLGIVEMRTGDRGTGPVRVKAITVYDSASDLVREAVQRGLAVESRKAELAGAEMWPSHRAVPDAAEPPAHVKTWKPTPAPAKATTFRPATGGKGAA
jgi:hypothetical protein